MDDCAIAVTDQAEAALGSENQEYSNLAQKSDFADGTYENETPVQFVVSELSDISLRSPCGQQKGGEDYSS